MEFLIKRESKGYPHKRHWQFCVGSGRALLVLRTDYTRQLKMIHDTLGIERVRFHGILSDEMRTCNDLQMLLPLPLDGAEKFREYNFNACGIAYDNVLEAGMKPFVELSFMPKLLMDRDVEGSKTGLFFYEPVIVPPKNDKEWTDYIQAFVRFLIHRYGAEEVRTWYFEVWNEPDLPMAFFNGTRDDYFHFYEVTARAIKDIDPKIRIGGPATSGSKWIKSFLAFCSDKKVPVDFVSTHQYAGDPLGGVEDQGEGSADDQGETEDVGTALTEMKRRAEKELNSMENKVLLDGFRVFMPDKSETTEIPNDGFRLNSAVARKQAGSFPLFYTEWNENAIFSAYTNDTRKVAAYDVKAALEVEDNLDGSSIWCFSDIFEELHPFPQEFHGGFGILTQSGIPKPLYHALKMLSDAGDERIDLGEDATMGEVGIAAFRGNGAMQVLLFRQKMKNHDLEKEHVTVQVEMENAPVRVTVRRIDEDHGNPLKLWENMGKPDSLNRAEIAYLKEMSAVRPEEWEYEYDSGVLILQADLGVNDICFFQIESP